MVRQHAEAGGACLLSTHEWDEAERLVDAVIMLRKGRVICQSPLSGLVEPGSRWLVCCSDQRAGHILANFPGVTLIRTGPAGEYLVALQQVPVTAITERLVAAGCTPETVSPFKQPLADIYRSIVKGD